MFMIIITITVLLIILFSLKMQTIAAHFPAPNIVYIKAEQSINYSMPLDNRTSFRTLKYVNSNKTFEATITCVGSFYNQSCLFTNLYYVDSTFTVLTLYGR